MTQYTERVITVPYLGQSWPRYNFGLTHALELMQMLTWVVILLGALTRFVLFSYNFYDVFGSRVEIITPVSSYKRGISFCFPFWRCCVVLTCLEMRYWDINVKVALTDQVYLVIEGLFLFKTGLSPYDGTVFHQAPLLLAVFKVCRVMYNIERLFARCMCCKSNRLFVSCSNAFKLAV